MCSRLVSSRLVEAVDTSLCSGWENGFSLHHGEEELMMAVKYKRRGPEWAEYSATDKRNPAVNCAPDCFYRFTGCLQRKSLLV